MNAITHLHTQNVTFLTLHCHLNRWKNTLGHTSEIRASCKSFHNLKHRMKRAFLLIMKIVLKLLIFLFLVLWLNFSFLLSIAFTQESYVPSCAAPNPWHLEKSPHWMPLCWQSSLELNLAQVDVAALLYIPWLWVSQAREEAKMSQIWDLCTWSYQQLLHLLTLESWDFTIKLFSPEDYPCFHLCYQIWGHNWCLN